MIGAAGVIIRRATQDRCDPWHSVFVLCCGIIGVPAMRSVRAPCFVACPSCCASMCAQTFCCASMPARGDSCWFEKVCVCCVDVREGLCGRLVAPKNTFEAMSEASHEDM